MDPNIVCIVGAMIAVAIIRGFFDRCKEAIRGLCDYLKACEERERTREETERERIKSARLERTLDQTLKRNFDVKLSIGIGSDKVEVTPSRPVPPRKGNQPSAN